MLVGVVLPHATQAEAEAGLDELALLVDTAGADVVERILQRRAAPDPATYLGRGKAEELAAAVPGGRRRHRGLRRRALARPAAQPGVDPGSDGHRPHRGDPRHLRPERPDPRRAGPGGAGPAPLPPAAPAGPGPVPQPTGRRHRHPGPGRDQARGRPSPPGPPHEPARGRPPPAGPDPAHPAAGPGPFPTAGRLTGRLHQRREVDPAQPAVRCRRRWSRTGCSRLSTPGPASWRSPVARRSSSPTRSASCASSRTSWSRPSGRRSRRSAESDLLVHVVDGSAPDPDGQIDAVRTVLAEIGADGLPELLVVNKADR